MSPPARSEPDRWRRPAGRPAAGPRSGRIRSLARDAVGAALVAVLLLASVAASAASDPAWVNSFRVALLALVVGTLAYSIDVVDRPDPPFRRWAIHLCYVSGLGFVMLAYDAGGEATPPARTAKLGAILLLIATFGGLHVLQGWTRPARRRRSVRLGQLLVLLAVTALVGVHLYHADRAPVGSGSAVFGVGIGLLFVTAVLVVPRYVSPRALFWAVGAVATGLVGLGLWAYVVGPYEVASLQVGLYRDTIEPPVLLAPFHHAQSVFVNPNTLGKWAYAGTVVAFVGLHRTVRRHGNPVGALILAVVVAVNVAGLYVTYSRASWLATAGALALYLAHAHLGDRALGSTVVGIAAVLAAFLAGILLGVLDVDPHGRFAIWAASVRAVTSPPSAFGAGIVRTSEVIAPYLTEYRGYNTHNSYLTMFIRAGIVGGLAYLALTLGSVLRRVVGAATGEAAVLALAFGFALDLLFVSYTLFHYNAVPVLATLAFGFLIADSLRPAPDPTGAPFGAPTPGRPTASRL